MFYNRDGVLIQNVLPNTKDRLPRLEISSMKGKPMIIHISRILVPFDRYDIFFGRGEEKDLAALHFNGMGEYAVRMKPQMCELRIAALMGVKDAAYQSTFKVGRRAIVFRLPDARHEVERWWRRLPPVSDNPGTLYRNLAKMSKL